MSIPKLIRFYISILIMIKNKLLVLFILFLAFTPSLVLAELSIEDVVPPGVLPPRPEPEPEPILTLTWFSFFKAFCINFIVNTFILSIGYLILKQRRVIRSWKFLKYIFFVTIGGALIDLIFVGGLYLSAPKDLFYPNTELIKGFIFWSSDLITFLGLVVYNYWLSRKFFQLTRRQALFIGIIMGIFTNPIYIYVFFFIAEIHRQISMYRQILWLKDLSIHL